MVCRCGAGGRLACVSLASFLRLDSGRGWGGGVRDPLFACAIECWRRLCGSERPRDVVGVRVLGVLLHSQERFGGGLRWVFEGYLFLVCAVECVW